MKQIPTLENYYATEEGKIFKNKIKEIIGCKTKRGYIVVKIGKKQYRKHRLIARTFIQNRENKPEINHINGIKDDNRVLNLEWVTPKENTRHSIEVLGNVKKGHNSHTSKLKEQQVIQIRKLYPTQSHRKLARKFNVGKTTIHDIIKKHTWKHI